MAFSAYLATVWSTHLNQQISKGYYRFIFFFFLRSQKMAIDVAVKPISCTTEFNWIVLEIQFISF